jgi:hypothetical protein
MVRVIYLGFFFGMKNSLIPLSFPSHSGFSQILLIPLIWFPLIPLSFPYHSPVHSVSPHFPSFPSHSTVIWFPLIPLSFPSFPWVSPHSVSPPAYPVLSRLSFSSPVLSRFSLAIPLFSEEAGQHHRFKGQGAGGLDLKDLLLIPSSHPSLPRQFPLLFASLSLFWIRWRGNRVGTGWGSCRMCKKNCVFYGLLVMNLVGFFCELVWMWRGDEEENWVWEKNWQAASPTMMDCLHSKYKYREIVFFGTDNKLNKIKDFLL